MRDFLSKWGGCISKLTAVVIAAVYLTVICFVHGSPYIWLSLTLVLMLCLTMFAYTRDKPLIRWTRRTGNSSTNNQNVEAQITEIPTSLWMTDVPPSYSYVMETNGPVTPPPSYGSALVMFPWIAAGQQSPDVSRLIENARFRSVSRQVSETSGMYNINSSLSRQNSKGDILPIGFSAPPLSRQNSKADIIPTAIKPAMLSRQTSKADIIPSGFNPPQSLSRQTSKADIIPSGFNPPQSLSRQTSTVDITPTVINNTTVTLSRQSSRQDGVPITKQLSAISRQLSQATVFSRQISLQENKQQSVKQEENKENENSSQEFDKSSERDNKEELGNTS